jgi:hypothetical protein
MAEEQQLPPSAEDQAQENEHEREKGKSKKRTGHYTAQQFLGAGEKFSRAHSADVIIIAQRHGVQEREIGFR